MKNIDLMELERSEFNITNIRPVSQYFKEGDIFSCTNSRKDSAFCYLSSCSVQYFHLDGTPFLSAEKGSVVYIPQDSKYLVQFHRPNNNTEKEDSYLSDYLVNFIIRDSAGNPMRFSDFPVLMCSNADIDINCLFRRLRDEECQILRSEIRIRRLMYELLEQIFSCSSSAYDSILRPAFDYISSHPYFNQISIEILAKTCHMHPTTFRRYFKSLIHTSPRLYIDTHFIRLADYNLTQRHKSVAETAGLLGFNDVSYFCRFYRKHTGISPGNQKNSVAHQKF